MNKSPARQLFCNPCIHTLSVFIVAILARSLFLIVTGFYGQVINNDAYSYSQIAASLLAGHGFAFGPGQPTAFRPFGYPFFLAAIYGTLGQSVIWVHWLQVILGSLLVFPTCAITRRLTSPLTAVLASLGVALHPVLLYLTALVAPEVFATLLQMCLLWFALRITKETPLKPASLFGFILTGAAAVLMRPELVLLLWLLAFGHSAYAGIRSTQTKAILAAVGLATILAVMPPMVRNYSVFGTFLPFPTVGGVTFWGANNGASNGGWLLPSSKVWPDDDPPLGMHGWPGLTEQQSQTRFYQASLTWIRDNPGTALSLIPRKLLRSWTLSYADEGRPNTLPPFANILNGLFGLWCLAGIILSLRSRKLALWALLAPVAAWLIKTVVFYGSARQTALALPILCIFAGIALETARNTVVSSYRSTHSQNPDGET